MNPKTDVLFVGLGYSAVAWYRCFLPAMALEADHVGIAGIPPNVQWQTGLVRNRENDLPESRMPDFTQYPVVVLQQPRDTGWLDSIKALQANGQKVLYEVDDWLHAIKNQKDHDFRAAFTNQELSKYEMCLKQADGVICSTDFLASVYRNFNKNVYVCENGLDTARYNLTRPERDKVNIGWAGATGHMEAAVPWLRATARVMKDYENTCFVSIGQAWAQGFQEGFGEDRAISVPFASIEQYPGAMTMLDIALAPASKTGFYRGKSDLRWLEAGALGIPIIANPLVYPKIEHRVNGFKASNPKLVETLLRELLDNPDLRTTVGQNAQEYVFKHRSKEVMAQQWVTVFEDIVSR